MLTKWKKSELHDSVMNLSVSYARGVFNTPIYKLDEHLIELREVCKNGTDINTLYKEFYNSPVFKEFFGRFFGHELIHTVNPTFIQKIGDIIIANEDIWHLLEIKTSEHSVNLFNVNADSFRQYTTLPRNQWVNVHFMFYSSLDMSMRIVRLDRFLEIQGKVPIYYYEGVDGIAISEAVQCAPFRTTLKNNGKRNPDHFIDVESNVYFQFDLNSFPQGSIMDIREYFLQLKMKNLYQQSMVSLLQYCSN